MKWFFRQGTAADVKDVFRLIQKRIKWMDEKDLRQWNTSGYLETYPIEHYTEQQQLGNLFLLENEAGQIIAAVVLYRQNRRWADHPDSPAYYVHHLVTDPDISGAGAHLLEQCEQMAACSGIGFVRLDCAADNDILKQYYLDLGYSPVGICQDGKYRGYRFEKQIQFLPV